MDSLAPETLDLWLQAARDHDDREAYQQLVESCHHLVRGVTLRETADPELADEIAQEVFVRGWLRRSQYQPGTNPRAWLLTIARNLLTEFRRRQARENRHLRELVRRELLRRVEQTGLREEPLDARRRQALARCLAELPAEQRELLELVHGQGLPTAEAAAILGLQAPTCRQRLSRLQRALRLCADRQLEETSS